MDIDIEADGNDNSINLVIILCGVILLIMRPGWQSLEAYKLSARCVIIEQEFLLFSCRSNMVDIVTYK